jgi:hypothetical protein
MVKQKNSAPSVATPKQVDNTIYTEVKEGRLIISMPWSKSGTVSKSEKSMIHASTNGNKPIAVSGEVYQMGVNVYKKK